MDQSSRRKSLASILTRPSIWWAVVMLLTAIVLSVGWDLRRPNVPGCLFLATCISIYASIGLWLGFGDSKLRLIAIVTATLAITKLMQSAMGGPQAAETFLLLLLLAGVVIGIVAGPIVVARVVRNGKLDMLPQNSEPAEVLQFRIVHLFALTTAVAVLTMLAKALWPHLSDAGGRNEWLVILKLGFTLGLCSLVVIWSALGRDALLRTAASALVTAGLASLNYWIIRSEIGWLWLSMTLIVWGQITVLMWLIRAEGFRFVAERNRRGISG